MPGLLKQAREGELEALEKVLRLDKMALEDPDIRSRYYEVVNGGNAARAKRVNDALAGQPLRKLTRRKVKVALAALIQKYSGLVNDGLKDVEGELGAASDLFRMKPLTAPDLRALFDAVAKDTKGLARDIDLPEGDHAFYMAITRELNFWQILP